MSANRPGPSGLFPNLARTRDDLSAAWVQMFRDLSTKVRESGLDPDAPAQQPTYNPGMERFGTESLYDERQTGQPQMTPEAWAETRQWGGAILFGPERESVIPFAGDASRGERFVRDWIGSEQEFRLAGQSASEGRLGAAAGWGALGVAGIVPVFGDAAQAISRGARAGRQVAGEAAQVARLIPEGRWAENPNAEQVPTDWLQQFATHDRTGRSTTPAYGREQVDNVKRELLERGFDDPLILDVAADGRAILFDGNHRLAAAIELGLEKVPVRVVTSRAGAHAGEGAEIAVREGLGSGKLLKPSEAVSDIPSAGSQMPGQVGEVAAAAAGKSGRESLQSSRRFDAEEAMFDGESHDWLRIPREQMPSTAYHVAPRSARESIEARGLDPSSSTWNTGAGQNQEWFDDAIWERLGDAGELIPIEYRPEGIYLFGDLEAARAYARGGGDIYEVDLSRINRDGGDIIRDPSVAHNWNQLMDEEMTYVTRLAPEGYFRRIEEFADEGFEDLIRSERYRVRNTLAPEQPLSSGVLVPSYDNSWQVRQVLDEFTSIPSVIPAMPRLNNQWMNTQADILMQYQAELLGPTASIVDELGALAHWQYVGNNNIQALLRTGRMPVQSSYEQAVIDLMGAYKVPRADIDAVFTARAQEAIPLLDNLIAESNRHGGFVAFRGVDRQSLDAAFGDDFYVALATNPRSLVGLEWTDSAYSATSLSPVRAREFAWGETPTESTMGVLFRVTVPNGTGAAPVNGYLNPYNPRFTEEFEMLIGRGSTFRITEVVTPLDQAELLNPKWTNTVWDPDKNVWAHLRRDNIPVVHIEVVP
jgi:hypothetical protein